MARDCTSSSRRCLATAFAVSARSSSPRRPAMSSMVTLTSAYEAAPVFVRIRLENPARSPTTPRLASPTASRTASEGRACSFSGGGAMDGSGVGPSCATDAAGSSTAPSAVTHDTSMAAASTASMILLFSCRIRFLPAGDYAPPARCPLAGRRVRDPLVPERLPRLARAPAHVRPHAETVLKHLAVDEVQDVLLAPA